MGYLLGLVRFIAFVLIIFIYILIFALVILFIPSSRKDKFGLEYRCLIARTLIPILGIKIIKKGHLTNGPALLVSNHRSYIDPALVAKYAPILPIAKIEIGKWPLLGLAVKLTGILFVNRSDTSSRSSILHQMTAAWRDNHLILNYPEGTTSDQPQTLPFFKGAFATAIQQEIPIIPICIEYQQTTDAWIDNDTFIPHFIRCFGKWRTTVYLEIGPLITASHYAQAMAESKKWIDSRLHHYRLQIMELKAKTS